MDYFKIILIAFFSCFMQFYDANAQITNGGFESTTTQPAFCTLQQSLPSPWLMRNSCDHRVQGINSSSTCSAHNGLGTGGFAATAANNSSTPYREYAVQSMSLNGGTKYKVEFWVKRTAGNTSVKIGGHINSSNYSGCVTSSPACTWLNISNPTVSSVIAGNNNQWTKVIGFYTPPSSSTYYITIGNFSLTSVEGTQLNYFNLDDVSVTPCNGSGSTNPQLSINANAFCDGQPVRADGSTSTNVDCYRWELWTQGGASLLTASLWQTGTPSSNYNVNNLYSLKEGDCYRLKLVTIDECDQQETFEDFCIEKPSVDLTKTGANPYCEGDNITITATGDNGWTYAWSTGQNGTGLKSINVTANTGITQYTVTVTTSAGCTATVPIDLTIHSNNNIAPTTGGINNTGDFTYYINAPKSPLANNSFSFNIPTSDSPNEEVTISLTSALPVPNKNNWTDDNTTQETGTFTWLNPGPNIPDIGVHTFTVEVADNNACNQITVPYTFKINVACENCPLDVYYQDRHPNNKPLPATTEAGRKIVAGYNVDNNQPLGNVETGTASVLFEAPQVIEMVPGFTAGPNYTAQINPTACTSDCDICCNNFTGFTHGPIPNVFTPNGDLINDVWYVPDFAHPNCAFNAKHFRVEVFRPFGNVKVWDKSDANFFDRCCFFSSPSSSCQPNCPSPYPHSDIYWDGKINHSAIPGFPVGSHAPQGTYFYVVTVSGCGQSDSYTGFITLFDPQSRIANNDSILVLDSLITNDVEDFTGLITTTSEINQTDNGLVLFPNPTKETLQIKLSNDDNIKGNAEIYSVQGKLLNQYQVDGSFATINVTNLTIGTYFIKLTTDKNIYQQIFIKE